LPTPFDKLTFTNKSVAPGPPYLGADFFNDLQDSLIDTQEELNDFVPAEINEARNFIMHGGGTISWGVVANKFKTTDRFIFLPVPAALSSAKFVSIGGSGTGFPTSGVTDGAGAERASADGLTINVHESLWAVITRPTGAVTLKVLAYTDSLVATYYANRDAFIIAVRYTDGNLYLRNGVILNSGDVLVDGAAPGSNFLKLTGGTMTGMPVLPNDPTLALHAATKQYVDAARAGLDLKDSVRVATTANITLSGTQTIDGVAVVAGNRVLVKNQTTGSQNGIYVVAAGAWTRATDADVSAEVTSSMFVFVEEGTANQDSAWVLTTNDPITLGTTALVFTQYSQAGVITAGSGLSKSGTTLSLDTAIAEIVSRKNAASGYAGLDASTLLAAAQMGTGTPDNTKVLFGDRAWRVPSGGGSVDDMLSVLVNAEVSLSAGSTLTSTAFGKMHVLTGTAHTTVLPTASAHAREIIGFRVPSSVAAGVVFTLDGSGSETINGRLTLPLKAGESVILLSDGTNLVIFNPKTYVGMSAYKTTTTVLSASTPTKAALDTVEWDTHSRWDATNNRYLPLIPGWYRVTLSAPNQATAGYTCYGYIYKNGSNERTLFKNINAYAVSLNHTTTALVYLNGTTDYIEFFVEANAAATLPAGTKQTFFMQVDYAGA